MNNRRGVGILTDAALAELFLKAGDGANDDVIMDLLMRAVRNHMRAHGDAAQTALDSPLDFS
ncbi:hypothetical protein [Burkholderia pseudomultivorans]|uniref:Uncharacterized protein n=1 Tax=Burkholderia pseudomultivorans TaxID=1207504 RepID=A0A132EAZ1_9BURK|nr:hypothetical protein [Burkholderia pseudomultivorans]KWF23282.1 hypothetical protein WT56_26285 [Burkholderia pseudomultivorans]